MIQFKDVEFSYSSDKKVIDNLSFTVPSNSIFGFLGANGSGKTTAIRLMLGLCKANKGEISINEQHIRKNPQQIFGKVGTLIEDPSLYPHLTGKDNLALYQAYYPLPKGRIDEVLELVGLSHAKHQKAGKYSLGMKQRLGLAISILHDPELLILDEPLNGLDPKGIAEIRNLFFHFKQQGKTIFISSHILSEIESTCSDVCIIDYGKKLFTGQIALLKSELSANTQYIFECDNTEKAAQVLQQKLKIEELTVDANRILMPINNKKDVATYIRTLTQEEVQLFEVSKQESNLESLYLTLTK